MKVNTEDLKKYYAWLNQKETEIRLCFPKETNIKNTFQKQVWSEFVNNETDFIKTCEKYSGKINIYVGMNERTPKGTRNKDVEKMQRIFFDLDAKRKTENLSDPATEEELKQVENKVKTLTNYFREKFETTPNLIAMSGNGYQLFFDVNLEIQYQEQVKIFVDEIKNKFDDEDVKIDNLNDLARIVKVAGCLSIKGNETKERPHRLSKIIHYEKHENKKIEDYVKRINVEEKQNSDNKINVDLEEVFEIMKVNINDYKKIYGGEYQGKHPVKTHSNTTGTNFNFDLEKNVWHCWSCNSGGTPLDLLAIHLGKIKCDDCLSHKKPLRGKTFIEVAKQYEEQTGKKILKENNYSDEIDYIRNVSSIDFSEYKKYLGKTKHVINYELANDLFPLSGKKYDTLKKSLIYQINSIIQPTIKFNVGKFSFDNRWHNLILTIPGRGKSTIDNGMTKALRGFTSIKDAGYISHVEQLKGTMEKKTTGKGKDKETELIKHDGLLDNSELVKIDEAYDLLNESTGNHSESMRTIRKSMDTYTENEVSKPQVLFGDNALKFYSKSRMLITTHPKKFKPIFINSGTSRRFVANEITNSEINIYDSTIGLLEEKSYSDDDIKNFLIQQKNKLKEIENIKFEKDAVEEAIEWIDAFNEFLVYNENKELRSIGLMLYLPVKHYFFKCIAINSMSKNKTTITKEIAKESCADAIEFLLNTIETYSRWNNFSAGLNPWGVTDDRMADVCDWMLSKGATSKGKSNITSKDVKNAIGQIYGKSDRQSAEYWAKMKKIGLIKSSSSPPYTAWLGKQPEINFENDCIGKVCSFEKNNLGENENKGNIMGEIYQNSLEKIEGGMQTMQSDFKLTQKLKNYSNTYLKKEERRFKNGVEKNCIDIKVKKNDPALSAFSDDKNIDASVLKKTALSALGNVKNCDYCDKEVDESSLVQFEDFWLCKGKCLESVKAGVEA